jgi:hypothetical protein
VVNAIGETNLSAMIFLYVHNWSKGFDASGQTHKRHTKDELSLGKIVSSRFNYGKSSSSHHTVSLYDILKHIVVKKAG